MDHRSRFVFASNLPLEESIRWAVAHDFTRVDFNADVPVNYPGTFTPERAALIRDLLARHGVALGIHTLSAINMAEISPVMHAAIDEYLRQNFDLAVALGAGYVICHGGYHFGGDREARFATAIDRMRRAATWAEERGIDIYFENHNKEPDDAEMHYIPRDVAETRRFFDAITSPRLRGRSTSAMPTRPGRLRWLLRRLRRGKHRPGALLNDTHGRYEEHLLPGQGIVDFRRVFRRLTAAGYTGSLHVRFRQRRGPRRLARHLRAVAGGVIGSRSAAKVLLADGAFHEEVHIRGWVRESFIRGG
ncbi:MAG: sugar phosphate isomerase/epimerase family protein [Chloroflexia bacterium]